MTVMGSHHADAFAQQTRAGNAYGRQSIWSTQKHYDWIAGAADGFEILLLYLDYRFSWIQ